MDFMSYDELRAIKDQVSPEEYLELLYYNFPSTWIEDHIVNPQSLEDKVDLRDYQLNVINSHADKKILRCGRQIGKSFMIAALSIYYGIKRKGSRILIIGPQNTHITNIFDNISDLIDSSEYLKSQVKTSTKQPREIIFKNKNRIKGFTTGEASGGDALSIRGQCHPADTKISMEDGSQLDIVDVKVGDKVLSFNDQTLKLEPQIVTDLIDNGIKDVYKITTKSGRKCRATSNHPFYRIDGWKKLEELSVGDHIAIPETIPFGTNKIDESELKFIGYMIGDGNCNTSYGSNSFSVNNIHVIEEMKYICDNMNIKYRIEDDKRRKNLKSIVFSSNKKTNKQYFDMLNEHQLNGKYSYQKFISDDVMNADKNSISTFLTRLFSTDGWASGGLNKSDQLEIGYCTTSKKLVDQIQYLLTKYGIYSSIQSRNKSLNGKQCKTQYVLKVRDKVNIYKFLSNIGLIYGKEEACTALIKYIQSKPLVTKSNRTVPLGPIVKSEIESKGLEISKLNINICNKSNRTHLISKSKLADINAIIHSDVLDKYIDADIWFDPIVSIEKVSSEETYCLTIKNNHTFIADNIVVHNTANILFVDEADYVSDSAMEEVVIPTTNSFSNPLMYFSSTPSGRRGFFRNSWDSGFYETYHYPSSVGPTWTAEKEAQYKQQYTKLAYTHEFEAEWGDTASGVFSKDDMYESARLSNLQFPHGNMPEGFITRQYSYRDDFEELNTLIQPKYRILGVDWNKHTNGTRLCWVDIDKNHTVYLRGKWKIDTQEFTQNVAMQKIRELHADLKFDFIMVDIGFGSTQIEDLHLYGLKYPSTRLNEIVKPVATDSSIEITDIATGKKRKTYVKNFTVESTIRFMEQHRIRVPEEENLTTSSKGSKKSTQEATIFDQMNEFVIDKYTANGRPVYKCEVEDHDIDAFMFTIYGYITEVIKTQNMWSKVKPARPKSINYDKIIELRQKKHKGSDSTIDNFEKSSLMEKEQSGYNGTYINNSGYSRTINRSSNRRTSFGGRSQNGGFSKNNIRRRFR